MGNKAADAIVGADKVQGTRYYIDPQQAQDAHTHRGGSSYTKRSARFTHDGGEHDTYNDSALTLAIFEARCPSAAARSRPCP